MTVERALEVLGLSATRPPNDDEIRRAYLRAVKRHPPERDRDGFQQVREAYDFLKSYPWRLSFVEGGTAPDADERGADLLDVERAEPTSQKLEVTPTDGPLPEMPTSETPTSEPDTLPNEIARHAPSPNQQEAPRPSLLREALSTDDPAVAATAMIALYSRPVTESGPLPPALFCLRTVMQLAERGDFAHATTLLDAFERCASVHDRALHLSNEISARWRLAREVIAISGRCESLARAVARGLEQGKLHLADRAVDRAREQAPDFRAFMKTRAPTLWAALDPLRSEPEPKERTGFWGNGWPAVIALMTFINLVRLLGPGDCTPRHQERPSVSQGDSERDEHRRASDGPQQSESVGVLPEASAAPWRSMLPEPLRTPREPIIPESVPSAPALSFRERAQRDVDTRWQVLAGLLRRGDCQGVRESWPAYRKAAEPEIVDGAIAAARKKQVLDMCSELSDFLEEQP